MDPFAQQYACQERPVSIVGRSEPWGGYDMSQPCCDAGERALRGPAATNSSMSATLDELSVEPHGEVCETATRVVVITGSESDVR